MGTSNEAKLKNQRGVLFSVMSAIVYCNNHDYDNDDEKEENDDGYDNDDDENDVSKFSFQQDVV